MTIISYFPLLIVPAFPLLYYGCHSDSKLVPALGIILVFLGMSGPIIKRCFRRI